MRRRRFWFGPLVVMSLAVVSSVLAESLYNTAKQGDSAEVKRLIAQGADITVKDKEGYTSLHWAAFAGHAAVAEVLLAQGAEVSARSNKGRTPLYVSASMGHTVVVEQLLVHGAQVDSKDENYSTPLHGAARSGHVAVVERLLAHGADIAAKDKDGKSPLDWALRQEHPVVIEQLKQHAAAQAPRLQWEQTHVSYQYPAGELFTIRLPNLVRTPPDLPSTVTLEASNNAPNWLHFDPEKWQISATAPLTRADSPLHLTFRARAKGGVEDQLHIDLTIVKPGTTSATDPKGVPGPAVPRSTLDKECLLNVLKGQPCDSEPAAPLLPDEACLLNVLKGKPCEST
jgi:hypothetical protein